MIVRVVKKHSENIGHIQDLLTDIILKAQYVFEKTIRNFEKEAASIKAKSVAENGYKS